MTIRATRLTALAVAMILVAAFVPACSRVQVRTDVTLDRDDPTRIIFLIGDGMGAAHITAAKIELGDLNMERLTGGGLITTFAGSHLVTDSAASGTAFATGHKTYNGAISVSMSGEPLKTVFEHAEENGLSTGLVATCSITHATPAVFVAHVDDRNKDRDIAKQMAESDVDVLFGGGASFFLPNSEPGGARTDGLNLVELMRERMAVALTVEEFRDLPDTGPVAALLAAEHPTVASRREPTLAKLTAKALETLSEDEEGFVLMVEGSQIDWAGHENEHDWLVDEVRDFDEAVGVAMDYAEREGNTLVIVTADHETGAYAVLNGSLARHEVSTYVFGSGDHSAGMVPLLTYGPGAEAFGGIIDNTDVGRILIEMVGGSREQ